MKFLLFSSLVLATVRDAYSFPGLSERATTACKADNLLNALNNPTRTAEASSFCSAFISVPATTTVTTFPGTCTLVTYGFTTSARHMFNLYNVRPMEYTPTPLSYNSASPTPITVPGGAFGYDPSVAPKMRRKRDFDDAKPAIPNHVENESDEPVITPPPALASTPVQELARRASSVPYPTWLAASYPPSRVSSACSCISPKAAATTTVTYNDYTQLTTATCTSLTVSPGPSYPGYPAYCAPSLQVNAPQVSAVANVRVVPNFTVPSKMDCCAACTNVFNCVWWKFDFGTKGDPWSPGQCHYGYYTGPFQASKNDQVPAVCPNGVVGAVPANYPSSINDSNLNGTGYQIGTCGGALGLWQSSTYYGYPQGRYVDDCSYLPDPYYTGQCDNAI